MSIESVTPFITSSSVVPFSSRLQSFPAPGSFPMSWLFHYLKLYSETISSFQFSSVTQSCPTLCDPMDCSTPGLPVHHQLPEVTQTHVHWVSDAIWHLILCRPLLLLPSVFASIRVFSNESVLHFRWPNYWTLASASVLPMNIQDWFPLGLTGLISLLFKGLSRVFSSTIVQKHQFFATQE